MAFDFSVDPEFQVKLDWMKKFVKEEIKPLEGRLSETEAKLKALLGTNESAEAPGIYVSWKEQTRKAYAVAETKFRVLRVKAYTPDGEEIAA